MSSLRRLLASYRFLFGLLVLLGLLVLVLLPLWLFPGGVQADLALRLLPPNHEHWLGCDLYGQDILQALCLGARSSLLIAVLTIVVTLSVGTLLGLCAGYYGGVWDMLIMRAVDIVMAFPGILLAMSLAAVLGPSTFNLVISISITGWTGPARLVRSLVLSLREREYVLACISQGGGSGRLIFKHILPSLWSYLLITASFSFASVILVESSLSFLGLGPESGPPTWGQLLNQGRSVLLQAPHLSIFPGVLLATCILGCNFLGDALRDVFDPKNA